MAIGCKNCGGHFTQDELQNRKPPLYPWPLTPVGKRFLDENEAQGSEQPQCPACGQKTLRA